VVAVQAELEVPIVALGVGEEPDDLLEFDPRRFAHALLA
jgi:fused signal recognition particle receptor